MLLQRATCSPCVGTGVRGRDTAQLQTNRSVLVRAPTWRRCARLVLKRPSAAMADVASGAVDEEEEEDELYPLPGGDAHTLHSEPSAGFTVAGRHLRERMWCVKSRWCGSSSLSHKKGFSRRIFCPPVTLLFFRTRYSEMDPTPTYQAREMPSLMSACRSVRPATHARGNCL